MGDNRLLYEATVWIWVSAKAETVLKAVLMLQ